MRIVDSSNATATNGASEQSAGSTRRRCNRRPVHPQDGGVLARGLFRPAQDAVLERGSRLRVWNLREHLVVRERTKLGELRAPAFRHRAAKVLRIVGEITERSG